MRVSGISFSISEPSSSVLSLMHDNVAVPLFVKVYARYDSE